MKRTRIASLNAEQNAQLAAEMRGMGPARLRAVLANLNRRPVAPGSVAGRLRAVIVRELTQSAGRGV